MGMRLPMCLFGLCSMQLFLGGDPNTFLGADGLDVFFFFFDSGA